MAILNTLKKAFGFGSDIDEEFIDSPQNEPALPAVQNRYPLAENSGECNQATEMIFNTVVDIFNQSLPSFLAQSLDPEKQKKHLYDALSQDIRTYLSTMEISAKQKGENAWQGEREKLLQEAEALRKKAENLEEKKSEIKERQLSADRQKRALADRVRDLENQVLRLEAEKEQLDLENKSMMNKAKAAAVLENELRELKDNVSEEADPKALVEARNEIAALKQQLDDTKAENEKLKEGAEAIKVKNELNDAMASDFKKKAAEGAQQIKQLMATAEAKEEELLVKDARISDLETKVQELEAKCEESVQKADLEEIQSQLERFEDVKNKMDAHIAKLKAALASAQTENETLRDKIKTNLNLHNQLQQELEERIKQLETQLNNKYVPEPISLAQEDGKPYSEEVEELISGADWLVSVPKEESPMRAVQDNEDFGYNPPTKKNKSIDNDAQMSLFDF